MPGSSPWPAMRSVASPSTIKSAPAPGIISGPNAKRRIATKLATNVVAARIIVCPRHAQKRSGSAAHTAGATSTHTPVVRRNAQVISGTVRISSSSARPCAVAKRSRVNRCAAAANNAAYTTPTMSTPVGPNTVPRSARNHPNAKTTISAPIAYAIEMALNPRGTSRVHARNSPTRPRE